MSAVTIATKLHSFVQVHLLALLINFTKLFPSSCRNEVLFTKFSTHHTWTNFLAEPPISAVYRRNHLHSALPLLKLSWRSCISHTTTLFVPSVLAHGTHCDLHKTSPNNNTFLEKTQGSLKLKTSYINSNWARFNDVRWWIIYALHGSDERRHLSWRPVFTYQASRTLENCYYLWIGTEGSSD